MAKIPYDIPEHRKPCQFKNCCHTCTFVGEAERPKGCKSIGCEDYTPCKKCGANRRLTSANLCEECTAGLHRQPQVTPDGKGGHVETPRKKDGTPLQFRPETIGGGTASPPPVEVPPPPGLHSTIEDHTVDVTFPGEPPRHYSEDEKDYYRRQWEQYSGFYRDPTAYAVAHNIIIVEIELNWTMQTMIARRLTELNEDLEKKRSKLIEQLEKLRKMLPDREANEMSDDEKSLGMIYEKYATEKGRICHGGATRFLTPEAIALAPSLHFPVDLNEIYNRLGYTQVQVDQVLEKVWKPEEIPQDPDELLEFFGLYLKERYALPISTNIEDFQEELEEINTDDEERKVDPRPFSPATEESSPSSSNGEEESDVQFG